MQFVSVTGSGPIVKALIILAFPLLLSACAGGTVNQAGLSPTSMETGMPDPLLQENTLRDVVESKEEKSNAVDPDLETGGSWEQRLPDFTLAGLSLDIVDLVLGQESLRREEMAGHIRRYDGVDCQLYLVVFDGKIDHVEARDPVNGSLKNAEECGQGLARVASRQLPASF